MNREDSLPIASKIDIFEAARDEAVREFDLDTAFFQALEQDEILGGQLHVKVSVKDGAGDIFHVKYCIVGEVLVACDRCLEELTLPVELTETRRVSYAEEPPTDGETAYLEAGERSYDTAWDIYEMVETSLPIQRVHKEGECNADMLQRFTVEAEDGDDDTEEI